MVSKQNLYSDAVAQQETKHKFAVLLHTSSFVDDKFSRGNFSPIFIKKLLNDCSCPKKMYRGRLLKNVVKVNYS